MGRNEEPFTIYRGGETMIEFIVGYIGGSVIVYFMMKSKYEKRIDQILENIQSQSKQNRKQDG